MLAALRLPLTLVLGFLLVLIADALILQFTAELTDGVLTVDNFGWALSPRSWSPLSASCSP